MTCLGEFEDKILYMLLFAMLHLGTWFVIEPVLEGKTCKALPSAVPFLVIYAFLVRAA